jgi:hypothetical protein
VVVIIVQEAVLSLQASPPPNVVVQIGNTDSTLSTIISGEVDGRKFMLPIVSILAGCAGQELVAGCVV